MVSVSSPAPLPQRVSPIFIRKNKIESIDSSLPLTTCDECKIRFSSSRELENHVVSYHCMMAYQCKMCSFSAEDRDLFYLHYINSHNKAALKPVSDVAKACMKCQACFESCQELQFHLISSHKYLPCLSCFNEVFETPIELCSHAAMCQPKNSFSSKLLQSSFMMQHSQKSSETLVNKPHGNLYHPYFPTSPFPCNHCGFTFRSAADLQQHLASLLPAYLPFNNLENARSIENEDSAYHTACFLSTLSAAASKLQQVDTIGNQLASENRRHMESNSSSVMNWKKNFVRLDTKTSDVSMTMPSSSSGVSSSETDSASGSSQSTPSRPSKQAPTKESNMKEMAMQCIAELSNRKNATSTNSSISRTAGKQTFVCKLCQRTLSSAFSLLCHYRSHAGIKPYECSICNARFTQQNSLSYHLLIHQNLKPFTCDKCNRSYRNKQLYKKHMLQHSSSNDSVKSANQ